jgi:hypothetical protein
MVRHDDGRNPACKNEDLETSMPTKIEKTPLVLIGQNRRGNWVAKMKHGLIGGLFINRAAALKFALFENGNHPEAVVAVPGVLELDMGTNAMGTTALAA